MGKIRSSSPKKKIKVIAAIPAHNEASHIAEVIRKALKHVDEVIVADDGSTDKTEEVARKAGATVIRSRINRGAGEATRTCFKAARDRGADILVTIDGDGQHDAEEIPVVIAPILNNQADLVIGSRFLEKKSRIPRYRRFGIGVITFLLNFASRRKVTDSQSCFRAYSRRAIQSLDITEKGFSFSIQLLTDARRKGLAISEAPISCVYHADGSTMNPVAHGLSVAFSVLRLRLKSAFVRN